MVKMQNPLALLVSSLLFTSTSSALNVRFRQADGIPTPVAQLSNAAAAAIITPGPSLEVGDLRFARALPTIPSCATGCVASAVTKSTNCKLGDTVCECNNASIVNNGAAACVQSACGYIGAVQAQAAGEEICLSVLAGLAGSSIASGATPTGNNNPPQKSEGSSSSNGGAGGASPSGGLGGSSGGSDGGSNGGSNGGSSGGSHGSSSGGSSGGSEGGGSSGSHGTTTVHKPSKLSKGAIAGIVVGVVVGISAAAGAIWKLCVAKMKGGNKPAPGVENAPAAVAPGAPPVVAPVQTTQVSHADPFRPTVTPQTVSSVSPFQGSSNNSTSPIYPNATELPHGSYAVPPVANPAELPHGSNAVLPAANTAELPNGSYPVPPAAYAYPPHPLGQTYHEAHVQPPEMAGDTHIPQELHGGAPVYEMGSR